MSQEARDTLHNLLYTARERCGITRNEMNAGLAALETLAPTGKILPCGRPREMAERALAMYDARRQGGYKNQQIAAREQVRRVSGMGVRDLRKWLAANPK